jgi:hypothetical protein
MKCRILALLVLLGTTSMALADYAVIIVNLNAKTPPPAENNLGGVPPLGGGMIGGPPIGGNMTGGLMRPPNNNPMGSGFPGPMGNTAEDAADEEPFLIVAVVQGSGLEGPIAKFRRNEPILFKHFWKGWVHLQHKTSIYEVVPLVTGSGKVLHGVQRQFNAKYEEATKNKAGGNELRDLASWALGHGLLGLVEGEKGFIQVMDRLAATNPTDTAVAAYRKVKEDLARPLANEDTAGLWRKRLVETYKVTQTDKHHYAILHNSATDGLSEVQSQIDELEKSFQSYYYWWALQGITLPVPTTRQVAIMADKEEEFSRLKRQLAGSDTLAGSSTARREGLVLLSTRRNDSPYRTLSDVSKAEMWDKGFDRNLLLTATNVYTKGLPPDVVTALRGNQPEQVKQSNGPRTTALLLKAMEAEWERTSTTHQAARQQLFASGLVPRSVHVPEWLQSGVGSFFEMPLQSPWGGAGSPNSYWLPRFKEYHRGKASDPRTWKYGPPNNYADILSQVVTDELFRGKPGMPVPDEIHLRHARAAAWSLTYFLAHRERDKLRAYFKELGRMPRDLELDDEVLKRCFARAFDCVNPDGSVNRARFTDLATRWLGFINDQTLEAELIHREIRKFYGQMAKPAAPASTGQGPGLSTPTVPGTTPATTPMTTPRPMGPGTFRPAGRRPGGR